MLAEEESVAATPSFFGSAASKVKYKRSQLTSKSSNCDPEKENLGACLKFALFKWKSSR